jgi:hypothetical protein
MAAGMGFLLMVVLKFILISTNEFAFGTLLLLSTVFLSVTSIAWIPFRQGHFSENKLWKPTQTRSPSWYFLLYQRTSKVVSTLFLTIWGYIVVFKVSNISFYSNLAIIIYSVVFTILATVALTPFHIRTSSIKDQKLIQDFPPMESSQRTNKSYKQEQLYNQIPLIILGFLTILILGGHILLDVINKGMGIPDFLFLMPPASFTSIGDWFIPVKHPVQVFLTIAFFLVLIVVLIALYPIGEKLWAWHHKFPQIPDEIQHKLKTKESQLSCFQSILLFGCLLILFDFFLLTNLYATLSTVPDPTVLPKPWETYPEEIIVLMWMVLGYILSLILAGMKYMRSNLSGNNTQTVNHPTMDSDLIGP